MRRRGFLLGLLASTASVPMAQAAAPAPLLSPEPLWFTLADLAARTPINHVAEIARLLSASDEFLLDIEWKSDKPPSLWQVSWSDQPQFGNWRTTTILRGP